MKVVTGPFFENLKMAFATLRSNKMRSFLTIIGVVVGVITVMLISSIISGIGLAVEEQVKAFGTRSIFVYKREIGIQFGRPSREERMRPDLTLDDALALRQLSEIETSVPFLNVSSGFFGNRTIVSAKGKQTQNIQLSGTLPEIEQAGTETVLEGRWFTQSESDAKRDVCLIGSSVKETFFP
ncbi:MAG: ABC transporter permease, partial [Pyrinomonadaceae bacterium]